MAQKRQKPDPHFSRWGPDYEIDTSFGGMDNKYSNASIPEGIELLKGDIKDLATDYWESTKMEEGEWGKLPPLIGLHAGILRLLQPIKGLYDLEKKTGGLGVSLFKTIAGDKSRRAFLQNMIGNTKRFKDAQFKQMMKDAAEAGKRKAYKFPDMSKGSKAYKELEKEIAEIFSKTSTKHAEGGRAGFDDGGSTQKEIDKALVAIEKLKPGLMPESYEALIEVYKDKQKELDIGIMESAGGLGELLGEGGRIGMENGGMPKWLLKILEELKKVKTYTKDQRKIIRELAYPGVDAFTKPNAEGGRAGFKKGSTRRRLQKDYESYAKFSDYLKSAPPKFWLSPEKYGIIRDDAMTYLKERFMYGDLDKVSSPAEIFKNSPELVKFKKWWAEREDKASGGRIGMAEGMSPSERWMRDYFYDGKGGYDNRMSFKQFQIGPGVDLWNKHSGKAKGGRIGFQRAGSVPYLSRGWSRPGVYKSWRGAEMLEALPGLVSLMSKYKPPGIGHNKPPSPIEETKPPKKEPPKGEGIMSEIITTKLLEDLVDVEDREWDSKTGKEISTWKTYKRSDKDRPPTEDEIEDYMQDLHHGGELDWSDFGSTVAELDAAVEEAKAYERQMMDDYKTGKLDKYMSMDAKLERVLDADNADRPSGYDPDEEDEIRAHGEEKERLAIAKMNEAEEIARGKASGSPWYTDPKIPSPEEELRKEFPGIDDRLIQNILTDTDSERVANVKASLRKALEMQMQGKKPEGIIKTLKENEYYAEDVWETNDPKFADFFDYPRHPSGKRMSTREVIKWEKTNPKAYAEWRAAMKKRADKAAKKIESSLSPEVIAERSKRKLKGEGGSVGWPPVQFTPEQQPPFQGPPYETNRPKDAGKEILRRHLGSGIVGAPLPGGFSLDMPYGTNKEFDIGIGYGTDPGSSDFSVGYGVNLEGDDIMGASYQGDNFDMGVKKREGSDPTFGFNFKKKLKKKPKYIFKKAEGGIARRPNAVPPLSGPTPQGLTFLLGDDIVKSRIK